MVGESPSSLAISCLALYVAAISTTFPTILLVRQEVDAFVSALGLSV